MFDVRSSEEICKELERLENILEKARSTRDHAKANNFTPALIKSAEEMVVSITTRIDTLHWVLIG